MKKNRAKLPAKYKDKKHVLLLDVYELAKENKNDTEIWELLGITEGVWKNIVKEEEVKYTLSKARMGISTRTGIKLSDYSFGQLSDSQQKLWHRILKCENEDNYQTRIDGILQGHGEYARMNIFLYSLVHHNFHLSRAMRQVNCSARTMKRWREDSDFIAMVDSIQKEKGDFFESCLIRKCKEGDSAAILFVNRTFNRSRGYNEKVEIEHTGNVNHTVDFGIEDLDLPLEVLEVVLKAIKKKETAIEAIGYKQIEG